VQPIFFVLSFSLATQTIGLLPHFSVKNLYATFCAIVFVFLSLSLYQVQRHIHLWNT